MSMSYTSRIEDVEGALVLHIARDSDGHTHSMPLEALSNRAELLGYTDLADAAEAMVRLKEWDLEPPNDPETGENMWTELNVALLAREHAREEEVRVAMEEGRRDDPRSPRLRGALAARRAITEPLGPNVRDSGSVLSQSQRKARQAGGCPEPQRVKMVGRTRAAFTCEPTPQCQEDGSELMGPGCRASLSEAIAPYLDYLHSAASKALHDRGPNPSDPDPFGEDHRRRGSEAMAMAELVSRYQRIDDMTDEKDTPAAGGATLGGVH